MIAGQVGFDSDVVPGAGSSKQYNAAAAFGLLPTMNLLLHRPGSLLPASRLLSRCGDARLSLGCSGGGVLTIARPSRVSEERRMSVKRRNHEKKAMMLDNLTMVRTQHGECLYSDNAMVRTLHIRQCHWLQSCLTTNVGMMRQEEDGTEMGGWAVGGGALSVSWYLTQCTSPKAKESNPECQLTVQRHTEFCY